MYDWNDLRYFLAVQRSGTLVGAARRLKVDPTTVGRRISALEEQVGARLFVRGRDGWGLTPAGARMLAPAERVEDAALDASREVERAEAVPAGRVRLTTIEVLASRVVAPILRRFHERYPLVQFDIICTPRVLDLARGEADLALRVGRPTEPSLIARRLSTATERPYAAQRWLDRRGLLPEEITSMDGLEVLTTLGPDSWHGDLGEADTVLRSTNASTLIAAAAAGLGVAMVPDLIAEVTPGLVPLDGLGAVRQTPIWLVMHRDLSGVARVRAVADYLVERLALPGGRARAPALSSDG